MSPSLLAHLQHLARQTRRDVTLCRSDGQTGISVRDFYRPFELMRVCKWTRPS